MSDVQSRIPPVDRPRNPLVRLAYRITARQFGKIIAPMRVIYARRPRLLPITALIQNTMEHGLSLDAELRLLVQVQASRANGCAFCEDLALAQAVRRRLGPERFDALEAYRDSPRFTPRERAALAFTEAAVAGPRVPDDVFAEARLHFSETEVVELSWVAAAETYFNVQVRALGIGSDELVTLARRGA